MRHLTLTIDNTPEGKELVEKLEQQFRPFDYQWINLGQHPSGLHRWHRVPANTALLLMKSLFDNELVGSISVAKLDESNDATREVRQDLGVSEQIGVSVVRSKRLVE